MKKRIFALILVFASITAGLLIGEIVVRIVMPTAADRIRIYEYLDVQRGKFTRYDPHIGWAGIPSVDAVFTWSDAKSRVRQNRFGFRGDTHPFERSERRRIVCLGDSFVWGFGADEEVLFTRIVEAEASPPLEVVNLGVSGYGNDQMLLLWQQIGHRWQPDEVLLFVTFITDQIENVLDESYDYSKPVFRQDESGEWRLIPVPPLEEQKTVQERYTLKDPHKGHPLRTILKYSDLACLVTKALSRLEPVRRYLESNRVIPIQKGGYEWEHIIYRMPVPAVMQARWQQMEGIIRMLADDLAKRGIDLRLVIVPSVVQVYPKLWQRFIEDRPEGEPMEYYPLLPNRILTQMAASLGLPVLDLLPALRKAGERNPNLYFRFNRHWTADGHRVVADQLLKELNRR